MLLQQLVTKEGKPVSAASRVTQQSCGHEDSSSNSSSGGSGTAAAAAAAEGLPEQQQQQRKAVDGAGVFGSSAGFFGGVRQQTGGDGVSFVLVTVGLRPTVPLLRFEVLFLFTTRVEYREMILSTFKYEYERCSIMSFILDDTYEYASTMWVFSGWFT